MNSALWVSKTGLAAQDTAMATVANNLANVNTNGFKADRAVFEDLFYSIEKQPGAQADEINTVPSGIQLGSGVRVAGTQKVFTEGSIQTTGQPMDLAIVGRGFFQVESPNGDILYTENGQFQLNAEGVMVNAQGLPLTPAIEVPQGSTGFTVGADGIVTAVLPGDTLPSELGQITLVNFTNPGGLEALGGNLYRESVASGEAVEGVPGEEGLGQLKQGVLEGSNVQVVEAMVAMIAIQRAYEANAKVLDAASGMQQFLNQTV
ncbi:flagellar basal-body rod protein FlgG [Stutzerimonas kunmingensis]|jgi:flagellar basal-body rod protein FlgG|uniref:Flagellar basal-body rod protein FlgG n=4 Tax=Pseudomonadaceae TaxID=135621 RepID=A0A365PWY8_9GAMM|nr:MULTISPECIES: flagellar basal-body rod protein FlgG [Pseudomonadaceae]AZZ43639.1 flagellar basal-body rod protein FlgG [Pseudomonadaceae bacterium SI-3]MAL35015.1 flagellar basal-body rod protein FlgG [Pseudomonas sp.]MBU0813559.1 flagellar basal-body rod protein FlgG [Gammaproteobacteria bacterium]OHC14422.1 MAG: flagellar basal-body rod protein FlgG [Pseudomonadales bacterium GWC2_63_15]BAP77285.1 flagellar basal-body rod protein FlgG [Pseudomonas sp. MT-1]|tara:strand:+ start:58774 stop:59559 length:786 start_codon:yes stop_codon:yes gene_type:complete